MKFGGNGPIMATAFAAMGLSVTYVGNLGYPKIHPVFDGIRNDPRFIALLKKHGG